MNLKLNESLYKDLSKQKQLTTEQVTELSNRIKEGDTAAKNELATANLKLVVFYAKQYFNEIEKNNIITFDDLISEGFIGLLEACDKFNPEVGVRFSYYASFHIKKEMYKYIQNHKSEIRIPANKQASDKQIKQTVEELYMIYERTITPLDVEELDVYTKEEIHHYFNKLQIKSIDGEYNLEDKTTLNTNDDKHIMLIKAMGKILNEQQTFVIKNYYGIGTDKHTFREIGDMLDNVSKQRINQIHKKAMNKLRNHLNLDLFTD